MAAWRKVERAIELDRSLREMAATGVNAVYHRCEESPHVARL